MKKSLLVMSLGQVVASSPYTESVREFANLSTKYSWLPQIISYPFYYGLTSFRYGWDYLIGNQIEKYKTGLIDDDQFIAFLKTKFYGTDEELKEAWNKMCTIDTSILNQNLIYLKAFLTKNNAHLIVIATTNPLQYQFIMQQVGNRISVFSPEEISMIFSFEEGTTNRTLLFHKAFTSLVEKNLIDSDQVQVQFSLPEIKLDKVKNFGFINIDSRGKNLRDALESLSSASELSIV